MSLRVGLRGRVTTALLGVSALALAIAAVSLLLPLDSLLQRDAVTSLGEEARTAKPQFEALPASAIRPGSARLESAARRVARQTAAQVAIVDARGRIIVATDADSGARLRDAARAIREHRLVKGTVGDGVEREARVAVPLDVGGRDLGLALNKSLRGIGAARGVIERALVVAAVIALAGALLAGAAVADRLVRRLAALRDTCLRLAELGPYAEVHDDGTRDEVGDLTRTFATMQQRLRKQEQARRTFVAMASHELRTPLASLQLMLHSARDELDSPLPDLHDTREQLDRAVTQTERLSRLAGDLLDLSRLDAGVPLRVERIELAEIARGVIAEFEPRTTVTGASLQLLAPQSQRATGDPGSVAQILRILIDNALRHADSIDVEVGQVGDHPAISVSDAGPGVAPGDEERIFERFERGANPTGASGFGLGLAIGRSLARRMGGDLVLAPQRTGARFQLSLQPAAASAEPALAELL